MDLEDLRTPVSPRTLREVVDRLCEAGHVVADAPVDDRRVITGVCQDSRRVRPGDLYAALPGRRHHGADFASEASARGAVAMLSDRPSDIVPTVVVDDPRVALGPLAAWAYGNPSTAFDLYGVTGTNGKTSTVYLLEAALVAAGLRSGVVTGVTVRGPGTARPATRTTPEACELQQSFVEFVEEGVDAVAMEVSSHGLAEHRIDGSRFDVGVFTNLARDHLDYHPDMEAYYTAKARLFGRDLCERAAVCIDDDYGRRLAGEVAVPHLTFSARDPGADVYATTVRAQRWGSTFTLHHRGERVPVRLRVLGGHQVDNAVAALAALSVRGIDLGAAVAGIEALDAIPGRLERVDVGQPFLALVDYVHNTAGQHRLFPYLRSVTPGRIVVVLGATGERDPGKRAPLGFTAARYAEVVVVTDESAFSDDAADLRDAVAAGARRAGTAEVVVIPDRGEAIAVAVDLAGAGDTVLLAGRGHDPALVDDGVATAFDDRAALRNALLTRAY
ncbi:Mur ligase family protein [Prescottella equi]|uniref:Mur ligase family protein n=1 Tax=Rhodococcus hoagii TaxID=43767 RepID=UPI0007CD6745|nr:UDP-N-acetylmuramoyl-L-alanyl-D-glutamate--2,6-diaminopimelate ligase [Prescottella equi]MBM9835566.1 UDP-N-acetylmuramoyl-L-alanyl-D-glutamate--2,6-diaminopimelate ligase [Prescottella equi]UNQ33158.1 UDP-N-acetylmuramoyl-L-alanyl-D-glutamate--2,6-diaminopimelate ligase [Prescottella equi]